MKGILYKLAELGFDAIVIGITGGITIFEVKCFIDDLDRM